MRIRPLLCAAFILLAAFGFSQDVLVPGNPPLTSEMAEKYVRFMGWALDVPLTKAQEDRIRTFLMDTWKSGDPTEIDRTVTLLATRDQIEKMGLQGDQAAKMSLRKRALYTWRRNPTMPAASWGMTFTAAATRPLVPGQPPLTKQMEDAYEELGYFLMEQAFGSKPIAIDAMQRVQLYDGLARAYSSLSPAQRANFAQIPQVWVQVRRAWPTLSDADKASVAALARDQFNPKPKSAPGAKKPKPAAPTSPADVSDAASLGRLLKMTWVTTPDVFSKLSALGGPAAAYGSGW